MRETGIWMRFCLTCLVLPPGAQVIAQPTAWDFESDRGNWRPRSATMIVERVADLGAAVDGGAWLHVRDSHGKGASLFTIRFKNHDAHWQNAVALSWAMAGAETKRVGFSKDEHAWTFSIAGRKLIFDWEKGQAVLQP